MLVSVPYMLMVTCWERADLLAVMYDVFCVMSLSQMCPGPHQNHGRGWHRSKAAFLLWFDHLCFCALCFSCFRVCLLLPCGHLLGKD